jgi:hypothetical protein
VTGLILSISGGCQCLNIGIVGAICAYDYFGCGWVIIWGFVFSGPRMAWLLVCMWCVFPLSGSLVSVHSCNFILEGCSPMVQCVLVYACQQRLTGDPCLVWENSPLVVVRVQGPPEVDDQVSREPKEGDRRGAHLIAVSDSKQTVSSY